MLTDVEGCISVVQLNTEVPAFNLHLLSQDFWRWQVRYWKCEVFGVKRNGESTIPHDATDPLRYTTLQSHKLACACLVDSNPGSCGGYPPVFVFWVLHSCVGWILTENTGNNRGNNLTAAERQARAEETGTEGTGAGTEEMTGTKAGTGGMRADEGVTSCGASGTSSDS